MTYTQNQDTSIATFLDLFLYADDDTRRRCPLEARALKDGLIGLFERKTGLPVALAREGRDEVPRLLWVRSVKDLQQLDRVSMKLMEEVHIHAE